jgi:hypothetical protein
MGCFPSLPRAVLRSSRIPQLTHLGAQSETRARTEERAGAAQGVVVAADGETVLGEEGGGPPQMRTSGQRSAPFPQTTVPPSARTSRNRSGERSRSSNIGPRSKWRTSRSITVSLVKCRRRQKPSSGSTPRIRSKFMRYPRYSKGGMGCGPRYSAALRAQKVCADHTTCVRSRSSRTTHGANGRVSLPYPRPPHSAYRVALAARCKLLLCSRGWSGGSDGSAT